MTSRIDDDRALPNANHIIGGPAVTDEHRLELRGAVAPHLCAAGQRR